MTLRSRRVLNDYINHNKLSNRGLAKKAGLSPATIDHLRSGRRDSCNLDTATAIEEALGCPPGLIFAPEALPVAATTRQRAS